MHQFLSYFFAIILVYSYCSTATVGASYRFSTSQIVQKINTTSHAEIWSRVRSRLNLSPSKSYPLIQRHIRSYSQSQDYINKVARNAKPYIHFVLGEVEKRGMPSEIALLPIIESDFNPHCRSHKGALGIWQLMPTLGRMHGLKLRGGYDGRKDVYQSTKVALDHLAYLHKQFNGNWLLALAAYNSGEAKVKRAISKNRMANKSTDFWSLKLPKETTHFVPKLLALATIIKSPKQYGVTLPTIPNKPSYSSDFKPEAKKTRENLTPSQVSKKGTQRKKPVTKSKNKKKAKRAKKRTSQKINRSKHSRDVILASSKRPSSKKKRVRKSI